VPKRKYTVKSISLNGGIIVTAFGDPSKSNRVSDLKLKVTQYSAVPQYIKVCKVLSEDNKIAKPKFSVTTIPIPACNCGLFDFKNVYVTEIIGQWIPTGKPNQEVDVSITVENKRSINEKNRIDSKICKARVGVI